MSEKRRGATGWPCSQGLLVTMVLIASMSALSGCGSGQTDTGQTGNSVPVNLNISMSQESAAASTGGSRFWATVQSWLPSVTNAWAATADLRTLTVEVTAPDLQSPTTMTVDIPQPARSGQVIPVVLDVPVGPNRVFTASGLDASKVTIFQGESTPITLTAGQPATVNIILVEILAITTPSLPNGTVGFTYFNSSSEGTVTLSASGGTPPYTWSIVENLPPAPGLSLSPSGITAGQITGTPTTAGTFGRTYRVQDSNGAAITKPLALTVNTQLTIDTTTLPIGTATQNYSATVAASGGTPPYTWSVFFDNRPSAPAPGLALSPSGATAGQITGIPTTASTFGRTYRVQDSIGAAVTKSLNLTVNPPLTIDTTSLPIGCVGLIYPAFSEGTLTLSASGGTPPYTWSIVENLPPAPGLSLSPSGITAGQITGITTTAGTFTRTYRVTDTNRATATTSLPLTVFPQFTGECG